MNFMIRPYQRGEEQYVADLHKKLYSEEYSWGPSFTDYAVKIALDFAKKEKSEKEYRRYGVGTALINAFMEKAKSVGYQKLVLWTASPLSAAIHHYEKIGFQITGAVENHTWSTNGETLDEIKMEMDIGAD